MKKWVVGLSMIMTWIEGCRCDGILTMLSPFLDLERVAEEAAKEMAKDDIALKPFDSSYPLAAAEMDVLLQLDRDCRSQQSTGLVTWCTGNEKYLVIDGEENGCPPGVVTHPCTGRVLNSKDKVANEPPVYMWPWKGIRCDPYTDPTTVTHIYLPGESLKCELSKLDFSVMVSLEQLDLSYNELYGELPAWLGEMTMLRLLNLAHNELRGEIPSTFAGNDALELINLSGNDLSAFTLTFFDAFHRLRHLDLSSNNFALELSMNLFTSKYIQTVNLSHNQFYGDLAQVPIFQFLEAFDVSFNMLTGPIPSHVSLWGREDPHDPDEHSSLTILNLSNNLFTGDLPVLSNQSGLQHLDVHKNAFNGSIPAFPPSLVKALKPSMFERNAFLCPLPIALLPSNLTCICGNGYTILSNNVARVSANEAMDRCIPCPDGFYSNQSTDQKCLPCPAGSMPSKKADSCDACPPGTFTNQTGSLSCLPCPKGTSAANRGATWCESCLPGHFAADISATKCAQCPVGTFSGSKGATTCLSCPAGTYTRAQGEAECLLCPKDTYQDVVGSSECKRCPLGSIAPQKGHIKCSPCSPGSFYDVVSKTCRLCSPGTFTDERAQTECRKCKDGTVAEGFGSTQCMDVVDPGSGITVGNTTASKCEPGTFNDGKWRTCQRCLPGTYASERGAQMCVACDQGSFTSRKGASVCEKAPQGSFVEVPGATEAALCPPNHVAATAGAIRCTKCELPAFRFLPGGKECEYAKPGEVYEQVEWPRLALTFRGLEDLKEDDDEVAIARLVQIWTETLRSYMGSIAVFLHVLQVHQALEVTDPWTQVLVAVEMDDPTSSKTQVSPSRMKDSMDTALKQAINAFKTLRDELTELKSRDKRDEKAGEQLAEIVRSPVFRDVLIRQFQRMTRWQGEVPWNLLNVTILAPRFISTRAVACPAGTFYIVLNASESVCQLCPKGSYSSTPGALKCDLCPRGTFAAEEGLEQCKLCHLGTDSERGALFCVECSWFTYKCEGFWQDLVLAVGIVAVLAQKVYWKFRQLCGGNERQRQEDERVALMATVRAHGRTLNTVAYAPMGIVSADSLIGIEPQDT